MFFFLPNLTAVIPYDYYCRGGEKLYVTKDKRDVNQSKRPFMCWAFGLVLLAAAVVVAILASSEYNIIHANANAEHYR